MFSQEITKNLMGKTALTTRKKVKKIEMQGQWKKRNKEVVSKRVVMKMMIKDWLDRNPLIAKSEIKEEDALVQDQGPHGGARGGAREELESDQDRHIRRGQEDQGRVRLQVKGRWS